MPVNKLIKLNDNFMVWKIEKKEIFNSGKAKFMINNLKQKACEACHFVHQNMGGLMTGS